MSELMPGGTEAKEVDPVSDPVMGGEPPSDVRSEEPHAGSLPSTGLEGSVGSVATASDPGFLARRRPMPSA